MDSQHRLIREIIADGVKAPSGENSQPWRFIVERNVIYIRNITERDSTLYNFGQHGSFVAHGALIENIVISASHFGFAVHVEYFPIEDSNIVAKLTIEKTDVREDQLYPYLALRHTNRGYYERRKIPPDSKRQLIEEAEKLGLAKCVILDSKVDIDELSKASTAAERLMFESKLFHRFYYKNFFFKQAQEDKMGGFYVDVLGLEKFERGGIWFNNFWPLSYLIGVLGIWYPLYLMRVSHYKLSGAFAAVTTPSNERQNYIDSGRSFERLWLTATKLGIELQPCVGVLFLYESLIKKNFSLFTERQQNIVKAGRNKILERFGDRGEGVPMFFRLGYAEKPRVRSFRSEPIIDFLD